MMVGFRPIHHRLPLTPDARLSNDPQQVGKSHRVPAVARANRRGGTIVVFIQSYTRIRFGNLEQVCAHWRRLPS